MSVAPPTAQILIVDDDPSVRFTLERALRHEGYAVFSADKGEAAIELLRRTPYDLILLDLNLGPANGLQVLQKARQLDPEVVVIILTGHGSLESAVEALRLGAFDYLFKPTLPNAIRQRVREGLQQRQQTRQRQQILQQIETLRLMLNSLPAGVGSNVEENGRFLRSGPLVIDRHHRAATMQDTLLDLTTAEFDLLVCLVEAAPEPIPPRDLLRRALGYEADELEARDAIKWHIHHLRRKIEPDPQQPRYIKTVRYKGYFWSQ